MPAAFWVPVASRNQPRSITFLLHENSGRELQPGFADRRDAGQRCHRGRRGLLGTRRREQKQAGLCRRDVFVVGRRDVFVVGRRDGFVIGRRDVLVVDQGRRGFTGGTSTSPAHRPNAGPGDRRTVRAQHQSARALSGIEGRAVTAAPIFFILTQGTPRATSRGPFYFAWDCFAILRLGPRGAPIAPAGGGATQLPPKGVALLSPRRQIECLH